MTLKDLLNQALSECGFGEYTAFFSSSRPDAKQVLALAKREINELSKYHWQALVRTYEFTMSASTTYPLPADYRQFVPDTTYTDTRESELGVSPDKWAYYDARNISNGLRLRIRVIEDELHIQNPQDGAGVRMEYLSSYPVESNGGTAKAQFTADDDVTVLNDDLFIMGVIWRFRRIKGMEWQSFLGEYNSMRKRTLATDGGIRTISMIDEEVPPFEPSLETYV